MADRPTKKQEKALREIEKRYGRKPDNTFNNQLIDVLFVQYGVLWIGIEPDGYAHS